LASKHVKIVRQDSLGYPRRIARDIFEAHLGYVWGLVLLAF